MRLEVKPTRESSGFAGELAKFDNSGNVLSRHNEREMDGDQLWRRNSGRKDCAAERGADSAARRP
jgi:hypothetical protein